MCPMIFSGTCVGRFHQGVPKLSYDLNVHFIKNVLHFYYALVQGHKISCALSRASLLYPCKVGLHSISLSSTSYVMNKTLKNSIVNISNAYNLNYFKFTRIDRFYNILFKAAPDRRMFYFLLPFFFLL